MIRARAFLATALVCGCAVGSDVKIDDNQDRPTFEEFLERVYVEPDTGVFIVNGDTPIPDLESLEQFYWSLYDGQALAVHHQNGVDSKWSDSQKHNLTYCVSDSFGSNKAAVIEALDIATAAWESAADIDFSYLSQYDGDCDAYQSQVVFDVRPVSGQDYLARAFFPHYSRTYRNVLVDSSAFSYWWPLSGVLTHELGHSLGFRHEHTRPESGQCFEDDNWRGLTEYDSGSVMHYPQCGGTNNTFVMSQRDRDGAASLYGAPSGNTAPPPPPDETGGQPQTGEATGELAQNEWVNFQPLAVDPGTAIDVSITGTGDADLYVRFGSAPTQSVYDCRPFVDGSDESCSLTVPPGQTEAFISVHGYAPATYTLSASWVGP